jgi:hypothetical protein
MITDIIIPESVRDCGIRIKKWFMKVS